MEVSQALHRIAWQVLARPVARQTSCNLSRSSPRDRFQNVRSSSRAFSSTARSLQQRPEHQQPVSQGSNNEEDIALPPLPDFDTPRSTRPRQPHPEEQNSRNSGTPFDNRIDLSQLPGIGEDYIPPKRSQSSAGAKLNELLGKAPRPAPQTDSLDAYKDLDNLVRTNIRDGARFDSNKFDIGNLFDNIPKLGGSHSEVETVQMPLRLRPTLGRTQRVAPETGLDLTRAFRLLDMKCNANGVRRDENAQRFHIRRGQKKKLDRSRRWRALFKEGFLAECARVRRMRKQGW